jgi:hypothetical protein
MSREILLTNSKKYSSFFGEKNYNELLFINKKKTVESNLYLFSLYKPYCILYSFDSYIFYLCKILHVIFSTFSFFSFWILKLINILFCIKTIFGRGNYLYTFGWKLFIYTFLAINFLNIYSIYIIYIYIF